MSMINSIKFGNNTHSFSLPYGVCSTTADTLAKTVTVDNFSLETGATVIIKFTDANSVASPTLNVNGTGAIAIKRYGMTDTSTGTTTTDWVAGAVQMFTYDGTNWIEALDPRVNAIEVWQANMIECSEEDIYNLFSSWSGIAGLYQTGAVDLYNEQGEDAIKEMRIKSWGDLVADGDVFIEDGTMTYIEPGRAILDLPEKNKYGFYYNVPYTFYYGVTLIFNEDGSVDAYNGDQQIEGLPSELVVYSDHTVDFTGAGMGVGTVSSDGFTIDFDNDDGEPLTLKANNFVADLILPDDGSVTSLGGSGPWGRCCSDSLSGIVISNGVTSIDAEIFHQCNNLKSVVIPSSVTTMGWGAFSDCDALTSLTFEENSQLTTLGEEAFQGCDALTSVVIPSSVTTLGDAFKNCQSLTSVTFEENSQLTTLDFSAFMNCTALTSIIIPGSVTSIGFQAFDYCTSLASISYNNTMAAWNSVTKGTDWNRDVPATEVVCTDGTVAL